MIWPKHSLWRDYKVWFESVTATAWLELASFRKTRTSLPPQDWKPGKVETQNLHRKMYCNWNRQEEDGEIIYGYFRYMQLFSTIAKGLWNHRRGKFSWIGGAKPCSKEHACAPYKLQNNMSPKLLNTVQWNLGSSKRGRGRLGGWGGRTERWIVLLQLRKGQREAVLAVTTKCCTKIDK